MSKGKRKPSLYDFSRQGLDSAEEFERYWAEVNSGNDRSACLVSTTAIGHIIVELMQKYFIELTKDEHDKLFFERNSTLGTFAQRIDIAFALGFISRSERDDLNIIRRIRNAFAHSVANISFDNKLVADECRKLKNYKNPNPDGKAVTKPRDIYMETLHTIFIALQDKILEWQKNKIKEQKRELRRLRRLTSTLRPT